ncbi:MAG: futalosine hydrolase [Vicingaceae bacterium]
MNILLVAATQKEVEPLLARISWKDNKSVHESNNHQLTLLKTGVGMVSTALSMGAKLANEQYDLAINLGIAGAFDRSLALGEVVEVTADQFSELGAENGGDLLDLKDLGMAKPQEFRFESKLNNIPRLTINHKLKTVRAITVNTVHGNEASIASIKRRLNPQLESMEGAAFFKACNKFSTNSLQLRAISNYVEKRNRSNWKIDLAIDNLANETIAILKQL